MLTSRATEIYILGGARTPFGTYGGSLKDIDAVKLGTVAAEGALRLAGVPADAIDMTVVGGVLPSSPDFAYLARHVALNAGVPIEADSLTVNRLCGSGLQAVVSAAQSLILGDGEAALVGGTENMSQAPYALRNSRWGIKNGPPQLDDTLTSTLTDLGCGLGMGLTAENLARQYEISRDAQDAFAALSHRRAAEARQSGRFQDEIVPVKLTVKGREQVVDQDEHIRPDTTVEGLARLRPAFQEGGTVTAGNASGINDGAAMLVIATGDFVRAHGLHPWARIVSYAVAGVDPTVMGIGPVPASQKALERAGLELGEVGRIEINEAFAAQYLAVEQALQLDRERTNVQGGAIALGHPVGASGARLLLSLAHQLRRDHVHYGLASLCIGGGQGIAMVIETV
ncbi:thiolase family protein [Sulfobacillus harzensis]|uniref:Acetyl-CoA acetyltransferase n=1 Tax=Sulfobacillus harzensis TaxID=2729629 RepID=A0A7Y0Q0R0_9FIRM|nr:thiolase family protein [Sulfobacillus harzensis]NMP21303.1 thiolase family protein [Sulfobacillus harzensis]